MKPSFTISEYFDITPLKLYKAWLNSNEHSEMTGGEANVNDIPGAEFDAWDDYITGKNIKLDPGKLIVQSWRTTMFKPDEEDSQIEIRLQPEGNGTRLTLIHSNLPEEDHGYKDGWREHYFEPMKTYFTSKS